MRRAFPGRPDGTDRERRPPIELARTSLHVARPQRLDNRSDALADGRRHRMVVDILVDAALPSEPFALAVAALVVGKHAKRPGKRRHHRIPRMVVNPTTRARAPAARRRRRAVPRKGGRH
jgi:hypothetical protein